VFTAARHFDGCRDCGCNDWATRRHGLDEDSTETLALGWKAEDIGGRQECSDIGAVPHESYIDAKSSRLSPEGLTRSSFFASDQGH